MGDSRFACCLQGGGVIVSSGTVTITSSTIYGNTAHRVRDQVQKFPSPDGKVANVLASTHACTTANASTTQSVRAAETLKSSHRPDAKMADVLVSTLTHTTAADAPVNYRRYVTQRP